MGASGLAARLPSSICQSHANWEEAAPPPRRAVPEHATVHLHAADAAAMEVWQYIIAAVLVALSGLFSGLNLGLMSFAPEDLRIVIEGSPDESERRSAAKIQPLRKTGNLLLCTLLLGNTLVNAAIATLLADATAGVLGMFITTGLIVVFGEIVPQSVCSRYALQIGAASVPLVWLFVGITFIVAYPIAKVLDWALGGEMSAVYTKNELKSLIRINVEDPQRVKESGLTPEDGKLLTGALSFKEELVEGAMTPLDAVFSLPEETILDEDTMGRILKSGHTRIPVTSEGKAVAILYAKDLVGVGFERNLALKSVLDAFDAYKRVYNVYEKTSLGDCFALCKRERRHLLVVVEKISKSPVRHRDDGGHIGGDPPGRNAPPDLPLWRVGPFRGSIPTFRRATTTSILTKGTRRRCGPASRARTRRPTIQSFCCARCRRGAGSTRRRTLPLWRVGLGLLTASKHSIRGRPFRRVANSILTDNASA